MPESYLREDDDDHMFHHHLPNALMDSIDHQNPLKPSISLFEKTSPLDNKSPNATSEALDLSKKNRLIVFVEGNLQI